MGAQVKGRSAQEWLQMMVVDRAGQTDAPPEKIVHVGGESPYAMGRRESIEAFTLRATELDLEALRGRVLVCGCKRKGQEPRQCHAEVLVRLANPGLTAMSVAEQQALSTRELRYVSHFKAWTQAESLRSRPVVLACGSRSFRSREAIETIMDLIPPDAIVVQGEGGNADRLFAEVAIERGHPVAGFPAQWQVNPWTPRHRIKQGPAGPYDVAAGPLRNRRMLDAVLAHPGEASCVAAVEDLTRRSGTRDMVTQAFKAGLTVTTVNSAGTLAVHAPTSPEPPESPAEGVDVHIEGPDITDQVIEMEQPV